MSEEAGKLPATGAPGKPVPWTAIDLVLAVAVGTVLGLVVAATTAALLLAGSGVSTTTAFFVVGIEIYAAIAVMIWLLVVRRRGIGARQLGFQRVPAWALVVMVPLTLGVLYLNLVVSRITALFFGEVPTARDQLGVSGGLSAGDFVLLLIVAAVVAPIVEEVVFRGLLYRVVRAKRGVIAAAAVSALAFSLVHFIPLLVGVFFVFGLVLAAVAEKFDSLYPPIVLHGLNNAAAIGLLYAAQ